MFSSGSPTLTGSYIRAVRKLGLTIDVFAAQGLGQLEPSRRPHSRRNQGNTLIKTALVNGKRGTSYRPPPAY
jgi:hypothetical protein